MKIAALILDVINPDPPYKLPEEEARSISGEKHVRDLSATNRISLVSACLEVQGLNACLNPREYAIYRRIKKRK